MTAPSQSGRPPPAAAVGASAAAADALRGLARRAWRPRRSGVLWLPPVVVVGAVVHAWGMFTFPRWVDDPGTYLSQAWSVQYEHNLSPYSYFYDHAPAGWIQIAPVVGADRRLRPVRLRDRLRQRVHADREGGSIVLLYWLARRLRFSRPAAAGDRAAVRAEPAGARLHAVDVPGQPRHAVDRARVRAGALPQAGPWSVAVGAGLAFAMAALTKETIARAGARRCCGR